MNTRDKKLKRQGYDNQDRILLTKYITGFILSIILTLAAYFMVEYGDGMSYIMVISGVTILAVVQLLVQLKYFIHLGPESRFGWNKMIFGLMALILLIVVVGSIWIMNNLHYNGMSPGETETYIMDEERINR